MSNVLLIAREEWRYWLRSKLALSVVLLFSLILISVSLLTALRINAESAERLHHQVEAEQTFLSQPDRHPHRMVHYGHYVFRTPAPLALFDPGLDSVTGQSMFLEGHRQNSATFSASSASANLGGFSWLTPALVYQLLAPLLIILLGHASIIREREAGVLATLLAQGINGATLVTGKILALLAFVALLLIPLAASALFAVTKGESILIALSLVGLYFAYLALWVGLTLVASSMAKKGSSALATLGACWLAFTLVLPAVAVNIAAREVPLAGKIETELNMLTDERGLSDGHNVNDSAFDQLRSDLLQQYGVERVEDLEVNIRGVVARNAEEKLTETMNRYAEKRMEDEKRQANLITGHGWLSPTLAVAAASRALSATDLEHHHRFLLKAEQLRYEFVQGLNQVHVEQLSYVDDINRSRDEASSRRTRMDAANWQLLEEFRTEPDSASTRLKAALTPIGMLFIWAIGLYCALVLIGRKLTP